MKKKLERVSLYVNGGPDHGMRIVLHPGEEIVIGRGPLATRRLSDQTISNRHCRVSFRQGQVLIEDLKSSNGTRVQGEVVQRCMLSGDAVIQVGQSAIELSWIKGDDGMSETLLPSSGEKHDDAFLPDDDAPTTRLPEIKMDGRRGPSTASARDLPLFPVASFRKSDYQSALKIIGGKIARYTIAQLIGLGGMGAVYKAMDPQTHEPIALKVILRRLARKPELLKRFLREARIGDAFRHPNVVRILDSGEDREFAYLAMEYIKGQDVQRRLADGKRYEISEMLRIIVPIGLALSGAHDRGIVHRDIKPANIMVADDGTAKLLDLGLAKKRDERGHSILTKTGSILGTLQYMAPEQTRESKYVDGRADIYSLAATVYVMLACRPLLSAGSDFEMIRKIRSEEPHPLSYFRPELPQRLADAVARGLCKAPETRCATMTEFVRALQLGAKGR